VYSIYKYNHLTTNIFKYNGGRGDEKKKLQKNYLISRESLTGKKWQSKIDY